MSEATFGDIRRQIAKAGVKVYALCRITYDDVVSVEVKKQDFLQQIVECPADALATCCSISDDGNIEVG